MKVSFFFYIFRVIGIVLSLLNENVILKYPKKAGRQLKRRGEGIGPQGNEYRSSASDLLFKHEPGFSNPGLPHDSQNLTEASSCPIPNASQGCHAVFSPYEPHQRPGNRFLEPCFYRLWNRSIDMHFVAFPCLLWSQGPKLQA